MNATPRTWWIVNALLTETPGSAGAWADLTDWRSGRIGMLPVYASRDQALAAHPTIAAMPHAEQDHYLRCITVD